MTQLEEIKYLIENQNHETRVIIHTLIRTLTALETTFPAEFALAIGYKGAEMSRS